VRYGEIFRKDIPFTSLYDLASIFGAAKNPFWKMRLAIYLNASSRYTADVRKKPSNATKIYVKSDAIPSANSAASLRQ
jgi:hypothetical protein